MARKKLWYVLSVQSGKEKWLRQQITKKARVAGIDGIGRILIPTHPEERLRKGEYQWQNRKSFPGYLIVHMHYNSDTHTLIERMENFGVYGLLPLRPKDDGFKYPRKEPKQKRKMEDWEKEVIEEWQPTALVSEEAARLLIMKKVKNKARREVVKDPCPVAIDDQVKIQGGSIFEGCTGVIKAIRETQDDYFLTVELVLMGRRTRTGISHRHVEKVCD